MADAKRITMNIHANRGYSAEQIDGAMRLGDILAAVEEAITEWGEDALVVTHDTDNRYGANYGALGNYGMLFEAEPNPECRYCGSELDDEGNCNFRHDGE